MEEKKEKKSRAEYFKEYRKRKSQKASDGITNEAEAKVILLHERRRLSPAAKGTVARDANPFLKSKAKSTALRASEATRQQTLEEKRNTPSDVALLDAIPCNILSQGVQHESSYNTSPILFERPGAPQASLSNGGGEKQFKRGETQCTLAQGAIWSGKVGLCWLGEIGPASMHRRLRLQTTKGERSVVMQQPLLVTNTTSGVAQQLQKPPQAFQLWVDGTVAFLSGATRVALRCVAESAVLLVLTLFVAATTYYLIQESARAYASIQSDALFLAFLLELGILFLSFLNPRSLPKWLAVKGVLAALLCYSLLVLGIGVGSNSERQTLESHSQSALLGSLEKDISAKQAELEKLVANGYLGASRRLSQDLDILKRQYRDILQKPKLLSIARIKDNSFWLTISRAFLLALNVIFGHFLAMKIKSLIDRFCVGMT